MRKAVSNVDWDEILNKLSVHKGTIANFCRMNNVNVHQLYHRRKKLIMRNNEIFHAINLNTQGVKEPITVDNSINKSKDIKIVLGKAKIYIHSDDNETLSRIIKELSKLC